MATLAEKKKIFRAASDVVIKSGVTDKQITAALAKVDALGDAELSGAIRRSLDWRPLAAQAPEVKKRAKEAGSLARLKRARGRKKSLRKG